MPTLVSLRWDPFERKPTLRAETAATGGLTYFNVFFGREAWRFVLVQQYVEKLALTAVDFPPMQAPASFNLDPAVQRRPWFDLANVLGCHLGSRQWR
jgi:arylsulfatase